MYSMSMWGGCQAGLLKAREVLLKHRREARQFVILVADGDVDRGSEALVRQMEEKRVEDIKFDIKSKRRA